MTNSESSFIVSSMYDLLKPDGINVIELGSGKYQLMRPAALSNLHNIAFRSFTGDLLPFTNIELPKLKAELIMMTNGLKSVTLTGQDTMDLPSVNTYENTKQNIILSLDKAWTCNKDAESQVIYNIEEIVELMNEKLKDYFVYTAFKPVYTGDSNILTMYFNGYKQFLSETADGNFCSILYNTTDNKLYIPRFNSSNIFEMKEVYNSSTTLPSGYDRVMKAFFDPLSATGFIVYEDTTSFRIKVDVIRWDYVEAKFVQEQVETFNKPGSVTDGLLNSSHPTYPLHFFANGATLSSRVIGYCHVSMIESAIGEIVPAIKFTYYILGTKYTPSPVEIYNYIAANEDVIAVYPSNNVLYVYGIDIHTDGRIHLLMCPPGTIQSTDLIHAVDIYLPSLTLTSSGISYTYGSAACNGINWSCTYENYTTHGVYQSIQYNFTDIKIKI